MSLDLQDHTALLKQSRQKGSKNNIKNFFGLQVWM